MKILTTRSRKVIAAVVPLAVLVGAGLWWKLTHARPEMVYVPSGYGGYVPRSAKEAGKPADPLQPAVRAYNTGNYKDAEAAAERVIESVSGSRKAADRKRSARARRILAFCAARQKKLELARERFAVLKEEASKLPDKGRESPQPGVSPTTLEEEAAYQHAVCTAAIGDREAAEAEYLKFMRDYPESPLVDAAASRIERLHNGHMPPEAEAAWKKAYETGLAREREREREASMCGPECLAELLRRCGKRVDVRKLAVEMGSDETGTSMLALAKAAEKHGFSAKGLAVTEKGLLKQPLPLISLLRPGHYVIVERVTPTEVNIWDPYGKGSGRSRSYPMDRWRRLWAGVILTLQPKKG